MINQKQGTSVCLLTGSHAKFLSTTGLGVLNSLLATAVQGLFRAPGSWIERKFKGPWIKALERGRRPRVDFQGSVRTLFGVQK